jgi:hypothetical protein
MNVPLEYLDGYRAAQAIDRPLADLYIAHTTIGDPLADAAIAACADMPAQQQSEWLRLGVEGGPGAIADAPQALREFVNALEAAPEWFDPRDTLAGCRVFHGNSDMFLGAFVGAVLIEGFSTLISKSFGITGRLVDQGVNRLKQNNLHLAEIFMPGGLEPHGDGWRLSLRVRVMHARLRHMLSRSPEWETEAWGTPLSAAHIAFATAAFSGLLIERVRALGVRITPEQEASIMTIWRYSGHLMGVPPALAASTREQALRIVDIGRRCEPPPGMESIVLANGLINSAPIVAGITDPKTRRKLVRLIYRVSRGLIGDTLADQLKFPAGSFGALAVFRMRNRFDRLLRQVVPGWERQARAGRFAQMLDLSYHDGAATSFRMPQHLHAEKDRAL